MQMATIRLFISSHMSLPARDIRETTRACEYHIGQVIGVARGRARGPGPPPIKIPLTTKSYDNIAWRCSVAVFFQ